MIDLQIVEQAAASIAASAPRIKVAVAALQAQIDPTAQARVDAVGVTLANAATALAGILPSANGDELPPPPTGPPA
jgi:hypothetical protein